MRHKIAGNKLSRNSSLRKATLRDLAKATIARQRIMTTKAKAKEARKLVDRLITLGKRGTLADKRRAFSILSDHDLVSRLFNRTSPLFKNRAGGYTRIILAGNRRGDNAQLAYLELTEKEEIVVSKPKSTAVAKKDKLKAKEPRGKKAKQEAIPVPEAASETAVVEDKGEKPKAAETKLQPKEPKKEVQKKDTKAPNKLDGIRKFFRRKTT